MPKFETLSHHEQETTKVKLSRSHKSHTNWKHEEYEDLPCLSYTYANDDLRYAGKEEELRLFRNSFWERKNQNNISYQAQYERELYETVWNAINRLKEDWEEKLAKDLEETFKK